MLSTYPVFATIAVSDLQRAKSFYEQTLGFSPEREQVDGIMYRSGDSRFFVYPSQFSGSAQQTVASWEVDDLEAVVADLSQRGITFEQYDLEYLKTDERGIADSGGFRVAWFKDPDGNILAVGEESTS